jgi:hypothetical protein
VSTPSLEHVPPGPILVVADNDAIAHGGPRWAKLFQAAKRPYRVRLAGPSTVDAVAAEATSLGAVAIIWAGNSDTRLLAEATASRLALPVFNEEILKNADVQS